MRAQFSKAMALVSLTASLSALPVSAQSNVVFLGGGGHAQMCAAAAHNTDRTTRFEVTGSRLAASGLEVCTLAIKRGDLAPDELAGSYTNRGVLHFSFGDIELALQDFDTALRLTQTLPEAFVNRGYALVAMQRWAESIEAFDRGIELGVSDPDRAHFNRAIAHEELGHVREAYYDYLRASELNPEWQEPKQELSRFTVR